MTGSLKARISVGAVAWLALDLLANRAFAQGAAPDCAGRLEELKTVQTQALLDPLLTELAKDTYKTCAAAGSTYADLVKARQLARIRVGRNEIVGDLRLASKATTEADLTKWRDAAQTELNQVEDAYVQLMGAAEGGSLQLTCTDPNVDRAETGGLLSGPKYQVPKTTKDILANQAAPTEIYTAQANTCEARKYAGLVAGEVRWRRLATSNLCGGFNADGGVTRACITYGVFASAISAVKFLDGGPLGMKDGRLLSVLVPYAGVRVIPTQYIPYLSFDFNLYSAFITTGSFDTTPQSTHCGGGTNALVRNLPCEANPKIQPYGAILAGVTLGQNNVGYLTLAPLTIGYARVGSQGVHPYIGVLAGTLQLTGRF